MNDDNPILKKIDEYIQIGVAISDRKPDISYHPDEIPPIPFFNWCVDVDQFFKDNFDTNISYRTVFLNKVIGDANQNSPCKYHALFGVNTLMALRKYVIANPNCLKQKNTNQGIQLVKIYKNFHSAAIQLARRKNQRPPYIIEKEYDVQDLLHAFLIIAFDEVIREEWSPSYCGSSQKVDFLLKKEKIAIETKMTSSTHKNKDIEKELLQDIAHYKGIPDCNTLSCLIYDPDHHIENPLIFMSDLEKNSTKDFQVAVDIIPKRS